MVKTMARYTFFISFWRVSIELIWCVWIDLFMIDLTMLPGFAGLFWSFWRSSSTWWAYFLKGTEHFARVEHNMEPKQESTWFFMYIYIHIYMCVCVCVGMYVCLSVGRSVCLSVSLSVPTYVPIYLSIYLSIHPSIYLSMHACMHVFILCVCIYIYIHTHTH